MKGEQKSRLASSPLIVMSSMVLSRLTGFLREMLVPNLIGVNEIGDAYNLAFKITGLMYDLLVGGAIAAALIPVMSSYIAKKDEEEGWKAVGTFINVSVILMTVACFLGIYFSNEIVSIVAVGVKNKDEIKLTVEVTKILFPSVAFLMMAGITNGILNSYQRFAAAAYGPSIYNIGSSLSLILLHNRGVKAVAYGVMISSLIYFSFQFTFAFKNFKFYKLKVYLKHPGFIKLFKLSIPSLMSSSITQINIIISGAFTTLFEAGSVTAFNIADRTWQLPYGIFAQGIGIAILPTLSRSLAIGNTEQYKETLLKGLKMVLLLCIPSSIGIIVLKEPIIKTIFQFTSKFSEEAVNVSGNILMLFSLALLTQSIIAILTRAFYANNDTKIPLYIGVSTLFINTLLSYLFYRYTNLYVLGMALSYSICSFINAVVLLLILNKKMNGINLNALILFLMKVFPAAIMMGAFLLIINNAFLIISISKFQQFLYLGTEVFLGSIFYSIIIFILKIEEALYIKNLIFKKIKSILH